MSDGQGGADFSSVFGGGDGGQGGGAAAGGGEGGQGGDGGAAVGGGEGGQGGDGGAADPDWYQQISGDLTDGENASVRDWVKSTGIKDLNGLAKVARDNQRALRDSGRVKVPGEGATAEDLAAFHKAIGVPDDAKGYAMPAPKDSDGNPVLGPDGTPVKMNTPLLERLAGVAHQAGMPAAAWDAMVGDFVQAQLEELGAQDRVQQQAANDKMKEWGDKANANMAAVNNAMRALGLSRDEGLSLRAALGASRAMDILAKLGNGLAEDVMLNGSGSNRFGISAAEAQKQLDAMKGDAKVAAAIRTKGTPENIRYENLLATIAEEEDRKQRAA